MRKVSMFNTFNLFSFTENTTMIVENFGKTQTNWESWVCRIFMSFKKVMYDKILPLLKKIETVCDYLEDSLPYTF